ncbi:MAG: MoaD/ThiS family protein [Acidocella sp.]|nr:MoaD/ThiS family protein [Acidocella sp.]
MKATIHVELPVSLTALAGCARHLALSVETPVTQSRVIDALEQAYPVLRGTIRSRQAKIRRPFIRFFACQTDISHDPPNAPLPPSVCEGHEMFLIVTAIAGG